MIRLYGWDEEQWQQARKVVTLPRVSVPRSPALDVWVEDLAWTLAGMSGRDALLTRKLYNHGKVA